MRIILTLLLIAGLISCSSTDSDTYSDAVKSVLERLDQTLAESSVYDSIKEERIKNLKSRIPATSDIESLYWVLDELYHEYNKYNLDSTILYASLKLKHSGESENKYLHYDATIDIADMYIMSGMYHEASRLIDDIDFQYIVSNGFLPRYYHLLNNLYGGLAQITDDISLKNDYLKYKAEYRKKLYDTLGDDDISKDYIRTEMLTDSLKFDDAITILTATIQEGNHSVHNRAILHYLLGLASEGRGDIENALINYAESAICDLSTPIKDYKSLYVLAELLYELDDFERASRYITRSFNDAAIANVHLNVRTINSLLPLIYNSYNAYIKKANITLNTLLIVLSLLFALLTVAVIIVIRSRKKVAKKRQELREYNLELTKVNARLQRYIAQLKESNEIKETYISRYIDLCSDYIGRLDKYRSELRKLSRSGGYDAIQKELRSNEVIDTELAEFYAQFDATFLELFPDFIHELNSLLQDDKKIETRDGLLTTELRVCALIRLGITDSVKISEFLRRSVSTIYNYRVKMRNAAVNSRGDFEKEIMKIGK